MNKILKYNSWMLLIVLIIMSSCKKYLDVKSNSSLSSPSNITDFQSLLDDFANNLTTTPSFGETSTDDYFLTLANYNGDGFQDQHLYTWIYDFPLVFDNDWARGYVRIYTSNTCLDGMKSITRTASNGLAYDNVMGSALFLRAYNFLNLSWVYSKAYDKTSYDADLGIVLRLSADNSIASVRSSVKDCYQQIINDAMQSLNYLPAIPSHVERPSLAAAYGLLARTYLSMRQYDSAFKYSDLCLSIQNKLFDYNTSSSPFTQFNAETIYYTEMDLDNDVHQAYYANIDTTLYSSYDNNDLRKTLFFFPSYGYQAFRGNYTHNQYVQFTGIATDEMYLTRSECYARKGDATNALKDLNTLLITRWKTGTFVPVTAPDAATALSIILKERRKELLMRGLRWIDIKRLNKEGANIVPTRLIMGQLYTLPPNNNRYALPLPTDIIQATGMPQNPQ